MDRPWLLARFEDADLNGIFAGLDRRQYYCVASGTTITSERQRRADFCRPCIVSGWFLAVDVERRGVDGPEVTT